ncbi:MAG TPA: hypothetical protein PLJ60_14860 [Chryseolinea sp.]|nr:hypothetical protein [Chryseolinea sp.]
MSRTRIVFSVVFLLSGVSAKAQSIHRDSIAGVWTCVEAKLPEGLKIPAEEVEAINMLKLAIVKSKFLFKTNGLFEWQFQKDAPAVFQQIDFLNNQKWSVDSNKRMIYIGAPSENLMQIIIHEKEGIVYFVIPDTPLLLRMKKE